VTTLSRLTIVKTWLEYVVTLAVVIAVVILVSMLLGPTPTS
jgi:hypothetical protein